MIEFPELTKYIELKQLGSSASEIAIVAREDGLNSVESIFVLKNVFDLSVAQAKEIWIDMEGNEYIPNLERLFQEEMNQMLQESELKNQGGIS